MQHAHTRKYPNKKRTWGEAVLTQTTTVPRVLGVAVAPSLWLRRCGSAWWVLLFFDLDGQVPDDGMIVLGLASDLKPLWEFTDSYYGKPFIWCMLHNFGGNLGLTGRIDDVIARPLKDLANASSTMVGAAKNRKSPFIACDLSNICDWNFASPTTAPCYLPASMCRSASAFPWRESTRTA
jgi:hypothetical protein